MYFHFKSTYFHFKATYFGDEDGNVTYFNFKAKYLGDEYGGIFTLKQSILELKMVTTSNSNRIMAKMIGVVSEDELNKWTSNNPIESNQYKKRGFIHANTQVISKLDFDCKNCLDHHSSFDQYQRAVTQGNVLDCHLSFDQYQQGSDWKT